MGIWIFWAGFIISLIVAFAIGRWFKYNDNKIETFKEFEEYKNKEGDRD